MLSARGLGFLSPSPVSFADILPRWGKNFWRAGRPSGEISCTRGGDTSSVTASPCHLPLKGKAFGGGPPRASAPTGGKRAIPPAALPPPPFTQGRLGHLIRHGFAVPPSPQGEGLWGAAPTGARGRVSTRPSKLYTPSCTPWKQNADYVRQKGTIYPTLIV